MNRVFALVALIALGVVGNRDLYGSTESNGPDGINSSGLGLRGQGVAIGQVEQFRSGKPEYDTDASCCNSTVKPADVFVLGQQAMMNERHGIHALHVAGVIISDADTAPVGHFPPTGVAQKASLYSSSYGPPGDDQFNAAIASQQLASELDVKAINMSFGLPLAAETELDGGSLLTKFVDWSSRQDDLLYVVAGNQVSLAGPVPIDNFNGLTVAMSARNPNDGVFRDVSVANVFTRHPDSIRTFTDIVAPGANLDLAGVNGLFPIPPNNSGTSFAAPHVTGTIALLHEFATQKTGPSGTPRWDLERAHKHEIIKAVILNSADKIKDDSGIGKYLGMCLGSQFKWNRRG